LKKAPAGFPAGAFFWIPDCSGMTVCLHLDRSSLFHKLRNLVEVHVALISNTQRQAFQADLSEAV
jgi:hypothetical protein